MLYRTTTFAFDDQQVFRIFPTFLLRKRFDCITSVEAVWRMITPRISHNPAFASIYNTHPYEGLWGDMYTILAHLPNLSHLRIVIPAYECPSPPPKYFEKMWLQPLEKLRGKHIKTFEIWVPESYAVHFVPDETLNFTLKTFDDIPTGAFEDETSPYYRVPRVIGPMGDWICGTFHVKTPDPEVYPE
jgi:hypothetical protein